MLALQKTVDRAGLELRDVSPPSRPAPGEIQIGVIATGVCGTDLKIDEWSPGLASMVRKSLPVTLGHETVGRVTERGPGVKRLAVGDFVVVNPAIACGACEACRAGDPVGCLDRQAFGLVRNGAFASRVNVDARYAFHFPSDVPIELGALVEPLSIGAYALDLVGFGAGANVIVFGPGPIGQGAAVLAREMGAARVAIVGHGDATRLDALRAMGFDELVDISQGNGAELERVIGAGFDIAIEAAGAAAAVNEALKAVRPQGIVALAGMGDTKAEVDIGLVVRNRIQIRGVSRIPPRIWPEVIARVANNPDAFIPLISHRMKLDDALEAFRLCRAGEASKILLFPE